MPNMKLIWLKTKELQSYKVDFSWQSIMGPLVIGSTSYHRKDLFLSRLPLIIRSTPYHRRDLLSSRRPLLIESAKHHRTSCHRKHLLSSRVPLIIGSTSYHRKDLFLSRVQSIMGPLVIGSTSYHRKDLLSSERPLSIGETSSTARLVGNSHFCQTGSVIQTRHIWLAHLLVEIPRGFEFRKNWSIQLQ